PIRVRHDRDFDQIFARLEQVMGSTINRHEVPNRYFDDITNCQPWYQFYLGNAEFVVGPRKRVIVIEVTAEQPFNVSGLRLKAVATDKVTYYAEPEGLSTMATKVGVHAWGRDKAVEYISLVAPPFLAVPV